MPYIQLSTIGKIIFQMSIANHCVASLFRDVPSSQSGTLHPLDGRSTSLATDVALGETPTHLKIAHRHIEHQNRSYRIKCHHLSKSAHCRDYRKNLLKNLVKANNTNTVQVNKASTVETKNTGAVQVNQASKVEAKTISAPEANQASTEEAKTPSTPEVTQANTSEAKSTSAPEVKQATTVEAKSSSAEQVKQASTAGVKNTSPVPDNNASTVKPISTGTFTGEATYYATGLGACGKTNADTHMIAAASQILFDNFPGATGNPNTNPICGRKVKATYKGASVVVEIVDRCVGCAEHDLDFSPSAFAQIGSMAEGRLRGMTWQWV